ncbi:uncharacterized protein LOC124256784 [Haliotis rubra]|uniref:uncharacterized protein LOC124256784 n=1 Tax=Haliotis rubra TaxID=36100 RepID=UPI001EE5A763|nr:uncharacterized protein LOC124256784 [Haliotis rubra]
MAFYFMFRIRKSHLLERRMNPCDLLCLLIFITLLSGTCRLLPQWSHLLESKHKCRVAWTQAAITRLYHVCTTRKYILQVGCLMAIDFMYRNRKSHLTEKSMNPCDPYCLLIFMTFLSGTTGARLTTSPSQITIGGSNPTSQLTVSCSPNAPGITQVFTIVIGKKSSTGPDQPIIEMTNTVSSVQVVDTSLQQRMTASGSISGATSNIQFILTDLRCADAASTYYCKTLYLAGSAGNDETTANITARTYPEQIEMFPSPDRVQYDDGQLLSIRCTGRIGNQFDENNLQNLWTWEWRSVNNEFASWARYPNDQNITYDSPTSSAECQYTGATTLVHTVSNLDNGRQFRCSVLSADYSANKTVYVVGQTAPAPPDTSAGASGASLTASPSQITIGGSSPTSQLTVSCRPNAPGITQVFSISIGKKFSTGSDQPIIQMTTTVSSVQVVDTSLQQRMTASGSISGATGSIQFILTDLRCADAASTYYCKTLYLAGSAGRDETTTNITARTYPEQIEMFPSPDRLQYDDGQLISFRCAGRIGNQFDDNNLQNLWTWEWRSIDTEFTTWTRYPNDQNITYDPPTSSVECQYTGVSTLIHTVSNQDNWRQLRCSVISADYSSNKTVNVVGQQPPGETSTSETPTSGQQPQRPTTPSEKPACAACVQENQESSLGVGVAIGVCVMLVVDAICLGLAFVFRDKLANCISGPKNNSNAEKAVFSNSLQAPATVMAPVGIQTQGVGDEYEVPVDRNDYDALQREAADVPNTYEKIRTYQNV